MKITITGGAGFIGSNLANRLASEGHEIIVIDSLSSQIHTLEPEKKSYTFKSLSNKINFIRADISEIKKIKDFILNAEVLVHLAAETGTGQSMYEIEKCCEVNVQNTAKIMQLLTNETNKIKKIIIASSRAIYGEGKYKCAKHGYQYPNERSDTALQNKKFDFNCNICNEPLNMVPTDEESNKLPKSIYGITKLTQEQLVLNCASNMGISAVALRFQNVYGPGQSLSNPYTGVLAVFATRIRNNNPLIIYEDGMESRDFVYITDVVDSIVESIRTNKSLVNYYNIGSGVPVTILQVAKTIQEYFKNYTPIEISGKFRRGDIRHNIADIKKAEVQLNYKPKILFDEGIIKFLDWVNVQPVMEDKYEQSEKFLYERGLMIE